jgi:ethanolamine utilization protein EutQ (cupin superfamily)
MSKLAEIKTKQTSASVADFIASLPNEQKRKDSQVILKLMEKAMKEKPKMWGSSMIGFGNVRYKSPTSGREVDWFKIGFSPRKTNLSLHLIDLQRHADTLKKLGKHKAGMGCLYINKLEDIDLKILEKIIVEAAK